MSRSGARAGREDPDVPGMPGARNDLVRSGRIRRSASVSRCASAEAQVPSERCPTCNGAGEVRMRKKMMITVPAGVDTGTKIRLKGQGGRGSKNGPPGDLLITFR